MKFNTRYSPSEPRAYSTLFEDESRTQQQFKAECDINNIMAKYKKTGLLTHVNKTQGNYGDFATLEDYQTSLNRVMQAEENFAQIPAEIRAKFGNDPGQLVKFLSDEKNNEDAYKYGLKIRPPKPQPSLQESMEKALETNDQKRTKAKSS